MNPTLRRARLAGAAIVTVAFAAGLAVGVLVGRRGHDAGPQLVIKATGRMPEELTRLGLSAAQREALQAVIWRGTDRVLRVVDDFDPRMQAAVDSTDAEIRALLTAPQRAAFDSARRVNGPPLRRIRMRGAGRDSQPRP